MRLGLYETVQAGDILEFGVGIQQECCVVRISKTKGVQLLQVCGEIVDSLRIEKLRSYEFVLACD